MLDNIKQTYDRNNHKKLMNLNDPLIDESSMKNTIDMFHNLVYLRDLSQKVPYIW